MLPLLDANTVAVLHSRRNRNMTWPLPLQQLGSLGFGRPKPYFVQVGLIRPRIANLHDSLLPFKHERSRSTETQAQLRPIIQDECRQLRDR